MDIRYEDYLDSATEMLIKVLPASFLDEEERVAIVSAITGELSKNIGDTAKIRNYATLIYTELVKNNDRIISEVMGQKAPSYSAFTEGLRACEQQQKLLKVFHEEGWPVPKITNTKPDECMATIQKEMEILSDTDRILSEDQTLSELLQKAQKELTVDLCDSAIDLAATLEEDITACKKKHQTIPAVQNSDTKRVLKDLKKLRQAAEEKEVLHNDIFQLDAQIDRIASNPRTTKKQWQEIIELCERQSLLLKRCSDNHWPMPSIKCSSLAEIEKQYKLYQRMNRIDGYLTEHRTLLSSGKVYGEFVQRCTEQQNNMEVCKQNGWDIPVLVNKSPQQLLEEAAIARKKIDRKKKAKHNLLLTFVILAGIAALVLLGLAKYREGRAAIPFDDTYVEGIKVDHIESELKKAGFVNISRKKDPSGWKESYDVTKVSVGNSYKFKKGTYLKTDIPIEIYYSSENRVYVTDLLNGWRTKDHESVKTALQKAGFTNIAEVDIATSSAKQENKTASIKLNDENYTNEHCYLPRNAPIVIEYYALKISVGFTNQEIIGQDYHKVLEKLTAKGFTDIQAAPVLTGWAKSEEVVEVKVNGTTKYDNSVTYEPDVPIIISYSSSDRVDLTDIVKDWKTVDYESLVKAIRNKGLEVKAQYLTTESKSQNRKVVQISIDNKQYTGGDFVPHKSATVTVKYYRLVIKYGDFKYKGENYRDVEKKLRDKGFSTITFEPTEEILISKGNEGKVTSIVIGGVERPKADDKFYYNEEVVLTVKTRKGSHYDGIK